MSGVQAGKKNFLPEKMNFRNRAGPFNKDI
ncbi:hypothetical protein EV199_5118 [Pseudobacter ginsenosidimutans]|uniref:Uncharacterized protein n=1 Tax=Pseudobacter ginsenosidimutans TaxID=661488 RepID=A0A4Q7MLI2_9BACT|nr:hypothetical protein EV199_5118 [Pseudobacter ginsenosidimutans]